MIETTFLMIKPDGIQRKLTGEILRRLENKGLKLVAIKMVRIDPATAAALYREHRQKPFYQKLICFIQSSPVLVTAWEGFEAVKLVRKLVGQTDPLAARPGTIRGDFSLNVTFNVVHASDSRKNAHRELTLFFNPDEIHEYRLTVNRWMNRDEQGIGGNPPGEKHANYDKQQNN